jgi:glycosyltransferase involved in cell wall biosynthesis
MSARVSIITPFYNISHEQFWKSHNSIMAQTSKDFEWILVNDGSDNSDCAHPDYDILLERNYGASVARNVGFQISSGDIITYLDMGDELAPDRVETLIDLFDEHRLNMLFSNYDIIDHNYMFRVDHFRMFDKVHPSDYLNSLQKNNISIPLGVAHTRKPFVEAGGFQRGIVCGEDGILWRRMIDKIPHNSILFSDAVAGTYYVSESGQSRTQRRPDMGGFAFDGNLKDNGKYLDKNWYETYSSEGYYD